MIVQNPEVTLEEDGKGFPEGARETAMVCWVLTTNVTGDDGRQYWIECTAALIGETWGHIDMWIMGVSWEKGKVIQPPGSEYKIADFPQSGVTDWHVYPHGTLTTKREKNQVAVDLEDFHLICKDDHTWQFNVENKEKGIKAELVHTCIGFPMWNGKEKPDVCTPHSIAYAYHWTGTIEGVLTIEGRKVGVKGMGHRERYYAVDACPAEVAGWHDDVQFHFDEMFGDLEEMKLHNYKIMSLYLIDEKQYFPTGSYNIEHHDWAYVPPLGLFVPTRYKITIETEAGVLEMAANVVGCHSWGVTGQVPDTPTTTLHWEKLDGTFTYKDGRKRTLTNGLGGCSIRQWKPYPDIFKPSIASTDAPGVAHKAQI